MLSLGQIIMFILCLELTDLLFFSEGEAHFPNLSQRLLLCWIISILFFPNVRALSRY